MVFKKIMERVADREMDLLDDDLSPETQKVLAMAAANATKRRLRVVQEDILRVRKAP